MISRHILLIALGVGFALTGCSGHTPARASIEGAVAFYLTTQTLGYVEVWIDGQHAGTLETYFTSPPACGAPGTVTVEGLTTDPFFHWEIRGPGRAIANGTASYGKGCLQVAIGKEAIPVMRPMRVSRVASNRRKNHSGVR